jgi:hypothetical protein
VDAEIGPPSTVPPSQQTSLPHLPFSPPPPGDLLSHPRHRRIRHDFVCSEAERREGYQEVPWGLWEALWQLPWASLPIGRRPVRQRSSRQTPSVRAGHQRQVAWVVRKAVRRRMITFPGLAVCWSSSYTRSETSRVRSHPRVMATGPDRHGAWRLLTQMRLLPLAGVNKCPTEHEDRMAQA